MGTTYRPPKWIKPQLTRLADEAPTGKEWLHEIKYDDYRMHARIDGEKIQLLTRTGLDWSHRYERTIEALRSLRVKSAYLDGELCALNADGLPVFSRLQAAMDEGQTDQLLFFAFDLLFLNGQSTAQLPLIERKERLKRLFLLVQFFLNALWGTSPDKKTVIGSSGAVQAIDGVCGRITIGFGVDRHAHLSKEPNFPLELKPKLFV